MAVTGFFNQQLVKSSIEKAYINVGSDQFRALTVALIDYFRNNPVNSGTLELILNRFADYLPNYPSSNDRNLPHQRLQTLINNNLHKPEFIKNMADVLHQIVVDELLANPLNYKEFFKGLPPDSTIDNLRQAGTIIKPARIFAAASAKALGIKLSLMVTTPDKDIPATEVYDGSASNAAHFDLILHTQSDYYYPKVLVRNKVSYIDDSHLIAKEVIKAVDTKQSQTIAPIIKLIEADDQRIEESYTDMSEKLLFMYHKGNDISLKDLEQLYNRYLLTNASTSTMDPAFFAKMEQKGTRPLLFDLSVNSDQWKANKYIQALARGISTGLIEPNEIFNSLEGSLALR